ncbi:MAG: guanylate kinase [Actinomycetota bacterium]
MRAPGRLVVVSAPSGAGKTTVIAGARRRRPDLALSLSATTRAPRRSERDGVDYRFVSAEEFERLERDGAFLETAHVHGNRYGTLRAPVQDALHAGKTVLLEIDIQGARSIRRAFPAALLVFIEPPSYEALAERLGGRGTEAPRDLERRLAEGRRELAARPEFDVSLVNDDLVKAVGELTRIIEVYEAGSGPVSPKEPQ